MQDNMTLQQGLMEDVQGLPPESLALLREFAQFLKSKTRTVEPKAGRQKSTTIAKLDGLLAGHDFSPEVIAEARREMRGEYLRGDAS